MDWIKITMKDGKVHEFREKGRAGGSYTISIKYEGGFAIITDEWYATTSFPAADIEKVETAPQRSSW